MCWWWCWSIFHVADACFVTKAWIYQERKLKKNMSCVWHIDHPLLKPRMWTDCGPCNQCIYSASLALRSPENSYLFIRTCWSASVWPTMSSSCRSECLGGDVQCNALGLGNWGAMTALMYVCGPAFMLLETHHHRTVHFLQKLSIQGTGQQVYWIKTWSRTVLWNGEPTPQEKQKS